MPNRTNTREPSSTSCPLVAKEQRDLLLRQTEDRLRDELLVAAEPEQTQLVEPGRDRVAPAVSQREGRSQPQGGAPGSRVLVAHRDHAEVQSRRRDRTQVRLVDRRVAERLALHAAAVTDQMRKEG